MEIQEQRRSDGFQPDGGRYAGRHRIVDHAAPSVPGYDVLEPIGQGGSGAVWSGRSADGREVAIKVVPAVDAEDALVELAVLGRITDPHLVRLHEAVALDSGDVALVLDQHRGGTVGAAVRARGHLTPGEAVTVLSPIASTLGRLHGLGVVHGDLSPGNVLLDVDGHPYLADLGVARILGERSLDVAGTDGFVAPEVAAGGLPSPASDSYGLGALAWFLLTGEVPGPAALRGRLADRVRGVSEPLVTAVESSLATRPEARPGADALAMAFFDGAEPTPLVLVRGDDDVSLMTRRIRAAARAGSAQEPTARPQSRLGRRPSFDAARRRLPRRTTLVAALRAVVPFVAVAAVVLGLVAGVLAWSGGREDARAVTPQGEHPSQAGTAADAGRTADVGKTADPNKTPDAGKAADAGKAGSPTVSTSRGAGTAAPASSAVLTDKESPRSNPVGLVRALADARAGAWSSGVAARLTDVDAPGSPALERDTEVLAGVQLARQQYVGLTFTVREATLVSAAKGKATVRARIDTSAHVVRGPAGEQSRPAESAAPVLLDLVHTTHGWRVHDVRKA
ncbi:protein kinase [Knoellia sinensis KCTC 19936]|uniref:non-specific serine/threonine protein kinase n=1 Tax=Knoellia sinensis KCTC 19936 TaxID=1385520 RepID=A0A0A0JC03_9MICO|nr:serine/threonine-protein kinase [Knoellia sinensis]KGN33151.1 protein kinase [Knoellia sinensis KCTC 19936]